jgi:hypothetical protein
LIRDEADIKRLMPVFGIDPSEFKYLSEMPAPEVVPEVVPEAEIIPMVEG